MEIAVQRIRFIVVAMVLLAPWAGAQTPQPAGVTLPPPLARVLRDYETAWRGRDAKALTALFTIDGFVLSSGSPPVQGHERIEAHYRNAGGSLSLRAFAYAIHDSLGVILGGYSYEPGGDDAGKFTLTLRQSSTGKWLIFSDMDNSNARP